MEATVDEKRLKSLLKEAVEEVLNEKRELLEDLVQEALEDLGMIRAIKESERDECVSREEVFRVLDSQA